MAHSLSHGRTLDPGPYGLQRERDFPPPEQGPIDLASWFAPDRRDRPIELDIGSGKGTFLIQHAPDRPHVNFIGLEYARAFWRYAADRIRRHALDNVRIVYIEAETFLRSYTPDHAFAHVHLYFPDPWPKKRHHKRRFFQETNLRLVHQKLAPGGTLRVATDHEDYFQWMREHARRVEDLFETRPFDRPTSAGEGELVGTNFERKYRREGRRFQAMILAAKGV